MKIEQEGNSTIIIGTEKNDVFMDEVAKALIGLKNQNIIIDLSACDGLAIEDIALFLPLSKVHKKHKKSFILVVKNIDYNAVSMQLTVVPTLVEARDTIMMEEIERDLGF